MLMIAPVAKSADASDLGSDAEKRVGSTPSRCTKKLRRAVNRAKTGIYGEFPYGDEIFSFSIHDGRTYLTLLKKLHEDNMIFTTSSSFMAIHDLTVEKIQVMCDFFIFKSVMDE